MSGFPGRQNSMIFAHSVFPDGSNSMIMAVVMFSPSVRQPQATGSFSVNSNITWLARKGTLSTPSVTYNYRPPDFSWQHIALSWSGHFGNSFFESIIMGSSYRMPPKWGEGVTGYPMPIICSLLAIVRREILPILRDGWMIFASGNV